VAKLNTAGRVRNRPYYLSTRVKFGLALMMAVGWLCLTGYLAMGWMNDLSQYVPRWLAVVLIGFIALLPGFMNAFLVASLLFDRRPPHTPMARYPAVSILVAAYNEEECIRQTVRSVMDQKYPGELELIVIDDGSTDKTLGMLRSLPSPQVKIVQAPHGGKAAALNRGLQHATHDLVITIDADTHLFPEAIQRIVARMVHDPPQTAAVAGAVLVRNSRLNWLTRLQEWDYFHGIASVKRLQSLYQGTLVAQGSFSVLRKDAIVEVGGWPETVGEDIVQTWALLAKGYRIGFAEDAAVFTNVPSTYRGFFQQRKRWARGLIEAFKMNPRVLFRAQTTTLFIYWNALFPVMDAVYLLVFLPGVVAALFGYYFIAGPLTLAVLPLALVINGVMFRLQNGMFRARSLSVRQNLGGFIGYVLIYQILMTPASMAGYLAELGGLRKRWGTK